MHKRAGDFVGMGCTFNENKATGVSIRKGYIGLQSESVPIMFRNIKLTPLR
ncbi:MAG TPA: hypothetical protein VMW24_18975 [Sedimentisphaerales bacterium]|nr:hypothetical protein [Sedimentisphaerales bacterium]